MHYFDDDAILAAAEPRDLITAIEAAFAKPFELPDRQHYDLPGDDHAKLLVMPAWLGGDAVGVKVATVMPQNAGHGRPTIGGLYMLLDGKFGAPIALFSAAALTAVRTAAVSGLAAHYLARGNARTLLVIGTGALAPHMIRAHMAVRSYERVLLWGRDPTKTRALAARCSDWGPPVEVAVTLENAVTTADVVSSVTASTVPLIRDAWVRPGTHLDLVGGFTPSMIEAEAALFGRGRTVIDAPAALTESGDLLEPLRAGILQVAMVERLETLARSPSLRPSAAAEITIFKSVGTGLADIAAAWHLYQRISERDGSSGLDKRFGSGGRTDDEISRAVDF